MTKSGPFYFKFSVFLVIAGILFIQCKTGDYSPDNYEGEMICFGEGGGFTGKITSYCLMEDGQLFRENALSKENKFTFEKRIADQNVEQLFNVYELLKFDTIYLNKPGNKYFFVEKRHDLRTHKITWGDKSDNPPIELIVFHANLMNMARSDKNKSPKQK